MNALEKLVKDAGFECTLNFDHQDFGYNWEEKILYVGAGVDKELASWFAQFLYEYGYDVRNLDRQVLPLLHELGHVMTINYFSEEELCYWYVIKHLYSDDSYEYAFQYWSYDDEFEANLWIMRLLSERPDYVAALAEALREVS